MFFIKRLWGLLQAFFFILHSRAVAQLCHNPFGLRFAFLVASSVTRLGNFQKLLPTNCHAKVTQIFGVFWSH